MWLQTNGMNGWFNVDPVWVWKHDPCNGASFSGLVGRFQAIAPPGACRNATPKMELKQLLIRTTFNIKSHNFDLELTTTGVPSIQPSSRGVNFNT